MQLYTEEYFATEGVIYGVYNVVTWSSFSVIRQYKASGYKLTFPPLCYKVTYEPWMVVEGQTFCTAPITMNYTACCVNATPKI